MHDPLDLVDVLTDEVAQLRESGHDVAALDAVVRDAPHLTPPVLEEALARAEGAPRRPDWPYAEPSDWPSIVAALPEPDDSDRPGTPEGMRDRIHAAWLGRCIGCCLGKPVEGWDRTDVERLLEETGMPVISGYLPPLPAGWTGPPMKPAWVESTRGRVAYMPRDDDLDYTVIGLDILERCGLGFTADDVLDTWLVSLPYGRTFTAERTAYRNRLLGLRPPDTARHRNPYREWIGALIRTDAYAMVAPTSARQAARLAFTDASASHTANGIYAAMWSAALLWEALRTRSPDRAVRSSMDHVPESSRLHRALSTVVDLFDRGISWEDTHDVIREQWGRLSWVHAIPNAASIASAVLHGGGEVTPTVGLAVRAGWDTDSCGATAGAVVGALAGLAGIPADWSGPLHDELHSAVFGVERTSIGELADRTWRLGVALGSVASPAPAASVSSPSAGP